MRNKKELKAGLSGQKVYTDFKYIYKQNKDGNVNLEIINKLNYKFAPKFIGAENNFSVIEFVKGETLDRPDTQRFKSIKDIIKKISYFHNLSKHKLGVTYCHGDLSPVNVIFTKTKKIKKIIDWDKMHIGDIWEDICYVIWLWCNFGSYEKKNSEKIALLFKTLKSIQKYYSFLDLSELQFKMIIFLNNRFTIRKPNPFMNMQQITKWHRYCILWWTQNYHVVRNKILWKI